MPFGVDTPSEHCAGRGQGNGELIARHQLGDPRAVVGGGHVGVGTHRVAGGGQIVIQGVGGEVICAVEDPKRSQASAW